MNKKNLLRRVSYSESGVETIEDWPSGLFDGLTLFRFAHMCRHISGGGVEAYLWNLNRILLERNSMCILQMYHAKESDSAKVEIEKVGRGELVWIPSILMANSEMRLGMIKRIWVKMRRRKDFGFSVNHSILFSTLANYQPDLAVFHWISDDSRSIINYLKSRSIPFLVVHHFHNKKLKEKGVRKQISTALEIAGVSKVDVPGFLKNRFIDIADGIDIDFFDPKAAITIKIEYEEPIIFLPARICEEKGHLDAVRALSLLKRNGVKATLAFAGREGNQDFIIKLKSVISDDDLKERVIFVGELNPLELRNWYAASDIVILPTYHDEGLPRVMLEAQAMGKPVLAYDSGGTRGAFLDEISGFLLNKGDIAGLASRIQNLLVDKCGRNTMGEMGRKFVVGRFSLDSLVIRHERLYASALKLSR